MLLRAFDLGITHFDLANNYGPPAGSAEETCGRVLAQDLRAHRDELAEDRVAGLTVDGFWPAFWGALIISIVTVVLRAIFLQPRREHAS